MLNPSPSVATTWAVVLVLSGGLTGCARRHPGPWAADAIVRDVVVELRQFDHVTVGVANAHLLSWQTVEDPRRNLVVEEALLWIEHDGEAGSQQWALVHAYRHPRTENVWHRSVWFTESIDPAGSHTRLGYRVFNHPPSAAEICDFLAHIGSSARDRAFRQAAAGTDSDAWRKLTKHMPPCGFAGTPSPSRPSHPPCTYAENAFRSGADPPNILSRSDVDLAGLTVLPGEQFVIVELRLDPDGRVTEACVLRGLADDIDGRVLAAVRQWRFEPARLRKDVVIEQERLAPGSAVPIFLTVAVRVAAN